MGALSNGKHGYVFWAGLMCSACDEWVLWALIRSIFIVEVVHNDALEIYFNTGNKQRTVATQYSTGNTYVCIIPF